MANPAVIQAVLITQTPADGYAGAFPSNVTAGNAVVLLASSAASPGALSSSAPKFNGSAVTNTKQLWSTSMPNSGNDVYSTGWVMPNVAGGSKNVSLTMANAADFGVGATGLWALEVSNLGANPTVIASSASSPAGSGTADSGTTGAATAVGIAVAQIVYYGSSLTPEGSPWTGLPAMSDGFGSAAYQLVSSGATADYTATAGSAPWAAGAAIILPTPAVSQVQFASGNEGDVTVVVSMTATAAGNVLVAQATGWVTGNHAPTVSSVSDNASGGTNVWKYGSAVGNQNPPVAGSYDTASGLFAFTFTAWCLPSDNGGTTKSISTVTLVITDTGAPSVFWEAGVGEYHGLPSNAVAQASASTSTAATGVTSYTSPAVTATGSVLGIATTCAMSELTGVSTGWTIDNYGDTLSAHNLAASGSVSATFTGSSQNIPGSSTVIFGSPTSTPSGPPLLMAAGLV